MGGYIERKRFEARVLFGVLGEMLKPAPQKAGPMSLHALAAMGFGMKGM